MWLGESGDTVGGHSCSMTEEVTGLLASVSLDWVSFTFEAGRDLIYQISLNLSPKLGTMVPFTSTSRKLTSLCVASSSIYLGTISVDVSEVKDCLCNHMFSGTKI